MKAKLPPVKKGPPANNKNAAIDDPRRRSVPMIRLTEAEFERVLAASMRAGLSLTGYARSRLLCHCKCQPDQ
jgi:hypothetical protein